MKRPSKYLLALVVTGVATAIFAPVAQHRPHIIASDVNNQTNAAFRDGVFLARLDAKQGRKPHLLSGRWSADADRRLFVAAYLQAYREMSGDAAPEHLESSEPAIKEGYSDGLADGVQQRYESRSFQPTATENYRRADRSYADSSGALDQYQQAYREAYCNGYQRAYYSETEQLKTLMSKARAGQSKQGELTICLCCHDGKSNGDIVTSKYAIAC